MLASQSGNEEVPKDEKERRWVVYKWNIWCYMRGINVITPRKITNSSPWKRDISSSKDSIFWGGLLVFMGGGYPRSWGATNDHKWSLVGYAQKGQDKTLYDHPIFLPGFLLSRKIRRVGVCSKNQPSFVFSRQRLPSFLGPNLDDRQVIEELLINGAKVGARSAVKEDTYGRPRRNFLKGTDC